MINSIKETYKDFYLFLKRPIDRPDPIQTKEHKVKRLLSLLVIQIPIIGVIGATIYGIEKLGLITTNEHKVKTLFQQLPLWQFTLMVVVIGPFMEELLFRFYLRFKNNDLTHFIILLVSATGKENKNKIEDYLDNLWTNKFRSIFLFSAITFGYSHLSNYEFTSTTFFLSPILIAPQFLAGLFLGYLRIKYNLMLGYFMHAIHNGLMILISIFIINY